MIQGKFFARNVAFQNLFNDRTSLRTFLLKNRTIFPYRDVFSFEDQKKMHEDLVEIYFWSCDDFKNIYFLNRNV